MQFIHAYSGLQNNQLIDCGRKPAETEEEVEALWCWIHLDKEYRKCQSAVHGIYRQIRL